MPSSSKGWSHAGWALSLVALAGCEARPIDLGPVDAPTRTDVPRVDAPMEDVAATDAPAMMDVPGPIDGDAPVDRDAPVDPDAPVATDAGADGGPASAATAEERAACANLTPLRTSCGGVGDEARCLAEFVDLRTMRLPPSCSAEYDAWVACLTTVSACPPAGESVYCPLEFGILGRCVRP